MSFNRTSACTRASAFAILAISCCLLTGCRDDEVSNKLQFLARTPPTALSLHVSSVWCGAARANGSRECVVDYRIDVARTRVTLPAGDPNPLFPAEFEFEHWDTGDSMWTSGYGVRVSTSYDGSGMSAQEAVARLQRTVVLAAAMARTQVGASYDVAARAGEFRDSYR